MKGTDSGKQCFPFVPSFRPFSYSSVNTVIWLQAKGARNYGSIPVRGKNYYLLQAVPTGYGANAAPGLFPDVKRPKRKADHMPPSIRG